MQNLKFYWNGIKHNGILYTGSWSLSTDGKTVTLYLRSNGYRFNDYSLIPDFNYDGAKQENNSDAMTDYFETTRIRFSGTLLASALEAKEKANAHLEKRLAKRLAKYNA